MIEDNWLFWGHLEQLAISQGLEKVSEHEAYLSKMRQWAGSCLFYQKGAMIGPDLVNRGRSRRASAWNHNPPTSAPPSTYREI